MILLLKIITLLFGFLLLTTPVYAGNGYKYSRPIYKDNYIGYKFVVLDKEVYAHSNHLNDLRVINDKDEEVPYFLDAITNISTEIEKGNFIKTEDAHYFMVQDGKDSIITIEVNTPNVFHLELNTDDISERNYGLFGITGKTKRYLSDGTFTNRSLDSTLSIQKEITWTDTNLVDRLELIIHNRDAKPITLKSVNVKYYLTKLVFKDSGSSSYRLAYGNDTLRSPIYDIMNNKATIKKDMITQSSLGAEITTPPKTVPPKTQSNQKLLFNITFSAFILLLTIGLGLRWMIKRTK